MRTIMNVSVSKDNLDAIKASERGTISAIIRDMIDKVSAKDVADHLAVSRTSLVLDQNSVNKIQQMSNQLDKEPGRIVRAIVEVCMQKQCMDKITAVAQ